MDAGWFCVVVVSGGLGSGLPIAILYFINRDQYAVNKVALETPIPCHP
jgi:hypothetical protein